MCRIYFIFCFLLLSFTSKAQTLTANRSEYTKADSLRGSLRPERTSYDVKKYKIKVRVNPDKRYISGVNKMQFRVLEPVQKIQIDLFEEINLDSVVFNQKKLQYKREFNAVFIDFPFELQANNELKEIQFHFSGFPKVAKNAPWDGGFVFKKDQNNNHFVGLAVQGIGASLWLPNKDHLSDEAEGLEMIIECPEHLVAVSNGRFIKSYKVDQNYKAYKWKVENPINNYNITINIGDYVHFSDQFNDLDLDYYVLKDHLEAAKKQFEQVKPMMACFYEKFGEYPFKEDGFKLVESPYLGMEHQSAVAYGNAYKNGYRGTDLSGTGIGLKWDFIIIHESGHEWFGNSITAADIADMWIHESFTSYSEAVFVECEYGKEAAEAYLVGLRQNVQNDQPIIGDYGVNAEGSGDMYYKGANMLHSIRNTINNDALWWKTIKKFHKNFKHTTTNTNDVINFFENETKMNLAPIFSQYLNYAELPTLLIKRENNAVTVKWQSEEKNFTLPVEVIVNNEKLRTQVSAKEFTKLQIGNNEKFKLNNLSFYYKTEIIN
ncbi:M1 family metallopeptidase [Psychroflexus sp. ALD_RP9]|uniref:M1 family metallopeptidase n=1 Tax=Psychroflexus sp. ALD_RP9 TaxID=2777186 RepID=UPI001A8C759B|nr:M1 family metallopeptidase [Psychroflexus sp. ALD_RP9]QSS97219.1 M1 family metallopeptidase [Psychroflexus sp. ALD_RP9]